MASSRLQRRLDLLLDEADEALSRFDWEGVRQRAQAVLAIDPDNEEGRAFLASAERALGEPASARESPATVEATTAELPALDENLSRSDWEGVRQRAQAVLAIDPGNR